MVSLRDLYLKNGYGLSRKLTVDCQVISVWVNYMNHRDLEVQPRLCLITSHFLLLVIHATQNCRGV
jgi:hypothetical protein